MVRRHQQQSYNKQTGSNKAAPELLNFHFSTTAPSTAAVQRNRRRPQDSSYHHQGSRQQQKQQQYHRTKQDRASARRKASAQNFYLHSSPDHAFVLTRHGSGALTQQQQSQQYSFHGPDSPVAWESVRMVKYLTSSPSECCPICLDSFCCARITKCGHNFCLPCAIRCVQSYTDNNPYSNEAKCPCCAIPMHLQDLRPVQMITTLAPVAHQHIQLVKLHRIKGCPAPFLPRPDTSRHSSPHAAPCQTDPDAAFCKFNYIDPVLYQSHLTHNLNEIRLQQQSAANEDHAEALFYQLAIERVQRELQATLAEVDDELEWMERFQNPTAGFYQEHPNHLLAGGAMVDADKKNDNACVFKEPSVLPEPSAVGITWQDEVSDAIALSLPSSDEGTTVRATASSSGRGGTTRFRGESLGSEPSRCSRADSMASSADWEPSSPGRSSPRQNKTPTASMFLEEEESAFYQASDGSLCFLSGFNMNTLRTEFSSTVPDESTLLSSASDNHSSATQQPCSHKVMPLPDTIEGRVVEVERVHLTPDLRSRLRFLSHLPVYSDICFVELGLGHLLSQETKKVYNKEFQKRKQARQNRINFERKADARAKREEEARINELKGRMQRIDPKDHFFHSVPVSEKLESGDDFGPALSTSPSSQVSTVNPAAASSFSFSQITREGGAFPSLQSLQTDNFPSLGSSSPVLPRSSNTTAATTWAPTRLVAKDVDSPAKQAPPATGKKKNKGKKIVLFSTGSHRGSNY